MVDLPGYKLGKLIGTGAGSRIYFAERFGSPKKYAVKRVVRKSAEDDKFIEQAELEYEVSSQIEHDNIRRTIDIHRVKGLMATKELAIVMEYVEGLTLEEARPNRLQTFVKIFKQVCDGLHAVHEAGWVHSDIKPVNILIAQGGVVKIIDFGQCGKMNVKKSRVQGTPDYIAPEQVRKLPLDRRTDIFNLGASMYWVLTSERYPTALRDKNALMSKPLAPHEWNDKIPRALSNLVMECCSDNPDGRPADMMNVRSRLETVDRNWKKYLEEQKAKLGGKPAASQSGERASGEEEVA